jgi:uncharacterized protein GlcG (DUF336 family)
MKPMQIRIAVLLTLLLFAISGVAQNSTDCSQVPDHKTLKAKLTEVVKRGKEANSGLGNEMWGVVVNRDGVVCAVVFTGPKRDAQWPGSRLIAAEKANTANSLSLQNFALSTANLYAATQPGGSLYGLITIAPPNGPVAFAGPPENYGQPNDPMTGKPIGGIVVFGGGFALYNSKGQIVGALGVSGDTSCADHVIGWRTRRGLGLDKVPLGPAPDQTDNMILDFADGKSASGFGHPTCKGGNPPDEIVKKLGGERGAAK